MIDVKGVIIPHLKIEFILLVRFRGDSASNGRPFLVLSVIFVLF
jgi:hypothetical protein